MQKHTILINNKFSSTTESQSITLQNGGKNFMVDSNGYFVNNVSGLNIGIVNQTNVRDYLNDVKNLTIVTDFFNFLTGNTNSLEFSEIFYSDEKLSNVFNNYYNTSISQGIISTDSIVNKEISSSTIINYTYSNFNWNGYAPQKFGFSASTLEINDSTRFTQSKSISDTIATDENYYIPIYLINKNSTINTEQIFERKIELYLENFELPLIENQNNNIEFGEYFEVINNSDDYNNYYIY